MNRLRIFVDSNILIGAVVQGWALEKAVLSVCSARICTLVLSEAVRVEVESNLLAKANSSGKEEGDRILDDYDKFVALAEPELIDLPEPDQILANRYLIRHGSDVPVLLSAINSKPDWLLTKNTEHFTEEVAKKTGLRIGTPRDFFVAYLRP